MSFWICGPNWGKIKLTYESASLFFCILFAFFSWQIKICFCFSEKYMGWVGGLTLHTGAHVLPSYMKEIVQICSGFSGKEESIAQHPRCFSDWLLCGNQRGFSDFLCLLFLVFKGPLSYVLYNRILSLTLKALIHQDFQPKYIIPPLSTVQRNRKEIKGSDSGFQRISNSNTEKSGRILHQ